ncbi:MAG: flagellar biosynthesis anti-sigma factor FlgM [bacterium]|nr:flagellar biosynthesis anti-sigma factor FlgM [bacterium]
MSDCGCNKKVCCNDKAKDALDIEGELKQRPRSPTLLNLSWLRDRLNRVKFIKDKLASSSYKVDPEETAKAMLNKD